MKPAAQEATGAATSTGAALNERGSRASKSLEELSDDSVLVRRVRDGDATAFRELFDRYHRRAYAVALGVVKNKQDAMDVVQEAFIKVHKHIGGFHGTSSFYTWLYRIVMNLAIDHVRKRKKVRQFDEQMEKGVAEDAPQLGGRTSDANPGRAMTRKELGGHIVAALEELPEYHRSVIVLREVEGFSYEEMARILKVPKGTIMSRLFHARRKMQELMKPYLNEDVDVERASDA
jgi:RNA polymerase sigma-70 factor (ECF subfamily)